MSIPTYLSEPSPLVLEARCSKMALSVLLKDQHPLGHSTAYGLLSIPSTMETYTLRSGMLPEQLLLEFITIF